MIVKIQRPLKSSHATLPVLVYNRDRSYEEFLPFSDRLKTAIAGREKMYADARLDPQGRLIVIGEVEEQEW